METDQYEIALHLTQNLDAYVEQLGSIDPSELTSEQLTSLAGGLFALRDLLDNIGDRYVKTSQERMG